MIELLLDGEAWIVLHFMDGTTNTFKSTFNTDILKRFGITLMPNFLFDLERLQLIRWRDDIVDVEIFSKRPEYEDEVKKFENRFV